jgi:hypothetical protein
MALPIIIPAAAALASVFGIGKVAQAFIRQRKAKKIQREAEDIARAEDELTTLSETEVNSGFSRFSEQKVKVSESSLSSFVTIYKDVESVTPLDFPSSIVLPEDAPESQTVINYLEDDQSVKYSGTFWPHAALGMGLGAIAGGLISYGAYKLAATLGKTNAGTQISSLSGVTLHNATLAWLGGGPMSSEGFGMVGGQIVLALLVAGPAFLLAGLLLSRRASKNIKEAGISKERAESHARETQKLRNSMSQIADVIALGNKTLKDAGDRLKNATEHTESLLKFYKNNLEGDSSALKTNLLKASKQAMVVKNIIDLQIIDRTGALIPSAKASFDSLARESASIASE